MVTVVSVTVVIEIFFIYYVIFITYFKSLKPESHRFCIKFCVYVNIWIYEESIFLYEKFSR